MIDQLNFIEKLAYNFLQGELTAYMKDIAWTGLEEGYETPALLMLAGLERNEENYVIHRYYKQALEELDLVLDKEKAALIVIRSVIDRVLNKGLDPFEACTIIFWDILESADISYAGKHFSYDGMGLNRVYGSYLSIDDTMGYSTDMKLLGSLKQEARMKMKEWLETYK